MGDKLRSGVQPIKPTADKERVRTDSRPASAQARHPRAALLLAPLLLSAIALSGCNFGSSTEGKALAAEACAEWDAALSEPGRQTHARLVGAAETAREAERLSDDHGLLASSLEGYAEGFQTNRRYEQKKRPLVMEVEQDTAAIQMQEGDMHIYEACFAVGAEVGHHAGPGYQKRDTLGPITGDPDYTVEEEMECILAAYDRYERNPYAYPGYRDQIDYANTLCND